RRRPGRSSSGRRQQLAGDHLVGIAAELGLPTTANYTLADNTRSVFTLAQLKMAALEIGGQVQTIFDKADVLRKQIESATTDTQLDAIQWPAT
ncbi:hypothetical protein, partial [Deinococcus sp.]|uniref:DUF4376 domain-containing protein n=1 Tax=Deinococcus sp. TaxID=47478 RepID=UPI00286E3AF8